MRALVLLTVVMAATSGELAFWDETTHAFITSENIQLRGRFDVTSAGRWPF